jgi:Zn-dependent protease
MNFLGWSVPIGTYAGISVRLHFTFFIFAVLQITVLGPVFLGIIWLSVLLHEFGHALAAKWCDGEAKEIILWPLGGLAMVRPAFHPTAHLITSAAGPFVSLVLAGLAYGAYYLLIPMGIPLWLVEVIQMTFQINAMLLLFNLIPAFPMDGGRIVRDVLWRWMGVERSTNIAVGLSKLIAAITMVLVLMPGDIKPFGLFTISGNYFLLMIAVFIFFQASAEVMALGWMGPEQPFSVMDRIRRGKRKKQFEEQFLAAARSNENISFHRCATCGTTEIDSPETVFRVALDGEEYCLRHLPGQVIS